MDLDEETLAILVPRPQWELLVEKAWAKRRAKQAFDARRMASHRVEPFFRAAEAEYQRAYAKTEAGHEARLRAQRAYRARLKARGGA